MFSITNSVASWRTFSTNQRVCTKNKKNLHFLFLDLALALAFISSDYLFDSTEVYHRLLNYFCTVSHTRRFFGIFVLNFFCSPLLKLLFSFHFVEHSVLDALASIRW